MEQQTEKQWEKLMDPNDVPWKTSIKIKLVRLNNKRSVIRDRAVNINIDPTEIKRIIKKYYKCSPAAAMKINS
jgi:hypothetical protein